MYLRIRNVEHNCKFSIKSWNLFSKYTFQCDNYLDETFIWRYTLTKAEKCRGMLGCHYPIHQEPGIPEQDIVYEVLIWTAPHVIPFTYAWLKVSCKLIYYVVCTQNVKWFISTHHVLQVVVSKIPKPSTTTESALLVAGRKRRRRRQLTTQTNSFTINRGVCLILPVHICSKGIIDFEKVDPFCRKINIFGTWQEKRD